MAEVAFLNQNDARTQVSARRDAATTETEKRAWDIVLENINAIYTATPPGQIAIGENNKLILNEAAQTWLTNNTRANTPQAQNIRSAFDEVTPHGLWESFRGTLIGGLVAGFAASFLGGFGPLGAGIIGIIGALVGAMFDGPNNPIHGMLGGLGIPGFGGRTIRPSGPQAVMSPDAVRDNPTAGRSMDVLPVSHTTGSNIQQVRIAESVRIGANQVEGVPEGNYAVIAEGTITGQGNNRQFNYSHARLFNTTTNTYVGSAFSLRDGNTPLPGWEPQRMSGNQIHLSARRRQRWIDWFNNPANVATMLSHPVAAGQTPAARTAALEATPIAGLNIADVVRDTPTSNQYHIVGATNRTNEEGFSVTGVHNGNNFIIPAANGIIVNGNSVTLQEPITLALPAGTTAANIASRLPTLLAANPAFRAVMNDLPGIAPAPEAGTPAVAPTAGLALNSVTQTGPNGQYRLGGNTSNGPVVINGQYAGGLFTIPAGGVSLNGRPFPLSEPIAIGIPAPASPEQVLDAVRTNLASNPVFTQPLAAALPHISPAPAPATAPTTAAPLHIEVDAVRQNDNNPNYSVAGTVRAGNTSHSFSFYNAEHRNGLFTIPANGIHLDGNPIQMSGPLTIPIPQGATPDDITRAVQAHLRSSPVFSNSITSALQVSAVGTSGPAVVMAGSPAPEIRLEAGTYSGQQIFTGQTAVINGRINGNELIIPTNGIQLVSLSGENVGTVPMAQPIRVTLSSPNAPQAEILARVQEAFLTDSNQQALAAGLQQLTSAPDTAPHAGAATISNRLGAMIPTLTATNPLLGGIAGMALTGGPVFNIATGSTVTPNNTSAPLPASPTTGTPGH